MVLKRDSDRYEGDVSNPFIVCISKAAQPHPVDRVKQTLYQKMLVRALLFTSKPE